jgi:L-lactate dehydrogenase complex protein LldE
MRIGLFIPCYINQFYPRAAIASLELLEKQEIDVQYPLSQTCCGQPMANTGFEKSARETYRLFVKNFHTYDYIVSPSGSCVYHVRKHFDIIEQTEEVVHVRNKIYELCEFLVKILGVEDLNAEFPFKVGLHQSCHGLRGLHLGKPSEIIDEGKDNSSIPYKLLSRVKGIQLINLERTDECCGFGGTFSVIEESVSVKMGTDRIHDHIKNNAEVITGTDMSCLMHLEGIIKRNNMPVKIKHIAEILNGSAR